jgi:2',3'-cyclic-nucleotide 2'-phosphodiesterase
LGIGNWNLVILNLNILFIGDIVSRLGRKAIADNLKSVIEANNIGLVIANCENVTNGRGITKEHYDELRNLGINAFTSGEHIYKLEDITENIEKLDIAIPLNLYAHNKGKRFVDIKIKNKGTVRIVSLLGNVFIKEETNNVFTTISTFLKEESNKDKIILVDLHAEATSEKQAMKFFLGGKVSAILGTHTHVQTNDAEIYNGTAYITDVGMTGSTDSVIGVKKEIIIDRMLNGGIKPFEWQKEGEYVLNAVIISIDTETKLASNITILRKVGR